jgi:hypothetical protein
MGSKSKQANWRNGKIFSRNTKPNRKRWLKISAKTAIRSEGFEAQIKRNLAEAK